LYYVFIVLFGVDMFVFVLGFWWGEERDLFWVFYGIVVGIF
jgi:hypothetical protein